MNRARESGDYVAEWKSKKGKKGRNKEMKTILSLLAFVCIQPPQLF